ncbi:MAG: hypothetical protein FWG91_01940 [Lachnospiraceae bacterium]|nr:hypothetical protein [Lachnospiraceae bacterium]
MNKNVIAKKIYFIKMMIATAWAMIWLSACSNYEGELGINAGSLINDEDFNHIDPAITVNDGLDSGVLVSASWAKGYQNISELARESDFIGIVEIIGEASHRVIVPHGFEQSKEDSHRIPLTVFSARVLDGIISDEKKDIEILMTGKAGEMAIFDDPLLKAGEVWMIFAKLNEDSTYMILGGPQGRFYYNEASGTITSLSSAIYQDSRLSELSLSDVKAEISERDGR